MTEKYEVAVIVGSLRADSYSSRLAQALLSVAPASLTFQSVGIATLPLYNWQKNMHTYLFRSREALLEADEAELVRDVLMDLDKASKKLNGIRERLKGVQENYATEMQSLKAAERKLAGAIVEALLSGQR
jgi:hypothetical protein